MPSNKTIKSIAASERWIAEYERMVAANDDAEWAAAQLPFWRNALAEDRARAAREDAPVLLLVPERTTTKTTTDHIDRADAERQRVLEIRAVQPGISLADAERQALEDVAYAHDGERVLTTSDEIAAHLRTLPNPFAPEEQEPDARTSDELIAAAKVAWEAEQPLPIDPGYGERPASATSGATSSVAYDAMVKAGEDGGLSGW